jgi:hypothetical protein
MATQNGEFLNVLTDGNDVPWRSKSYSVYLAGTTTLAPLFTSATSTTPAPNPGTTDVVGMARFYCAPGRYDLNFNSATVSDVVVGPAPGETSLTDVPGANTLDPRYATLDPTTGLVPPSQLPAGSAGAGSSASLVGATATTLYAGGTVSGAPTTGTFSVGSFVPAQNGYIWLCTAGGTPGTWVSVGPLPMIVRAVTTSTTATATDRVVITTASASGLVVTVAPAVTAARVSPLTIKNVASSTNAITITPGSGLIEGISSVTVNPGSAVDLISDGTNHFLI